MHEVFPFNQNQGDWKYHITLPNYYNFWWCSRHVTLVCLLLFLFPEQIWRDRKDSCHCIKIFRQGVLVAIIHLAFVYFVSVGNLEFVHTYCSCYILRKFVGYYNCITVFFFFENMVTSKNACIARAGTLFFPNQISSSAMPSFSILLLLLLFQKKFTCRLCYKVQEMWKQFQ